MNQGLFSYIRVFIIIAIVVGIPVGLAVFYSSNNSSQEAILNENLLLSPEDQKIEKQEALEETNSETVYAPNFSSKDTEGNEISLSSLRGNNILLVFWATWCGYCKKELPDLKNFVEKYREKIIVLTIVNQESPEVVREYAEQEKLNFPILIDNTGQIWNAYLVRGTPSHFLIDKEGKILASWPGYASKENLEVLATMIQE